MNRWKQHQRATARVSVQNHPGNSRLGLRRAQTRLPRARRPEQAHLTVQREGAARRCHRPRDRDRNRRGHPAARRPGQRRLHRPRLASQQRLMLTENARGNVMMAGTPTALTTTSPAPPARTGHRQQEKSTPTTTGVENNAVANPKAPLSADPAPVPSAFFRPGALLPWPPTL